MSTRIELTDTLMSITMKMAEGNPGAMGAIMEIIQQHDTIDPQGAMGGMGGLLLLDTWGIYGSDIYILFSDKCQKDVRKMLMIMRATQLGLFSHVKLKEMAADQSRRVDITPDEWQDLDDQVCEQLTEFAKSA